MRKNIIDILNRTLINKLLLLKFSYKNIIDILNRTLINKLLLLKFSYLCEN
jgi:hypothetical protein